MKRVVSVCLPHWPIERLMRTPRVAPVDLRALPLRQGDGLPAHQLRAQQGRALEITVVEPAATQVRLGEIGVGELHVLENHRAQIATHEGGAREINVDELDRKSVV